MRAALPEPATWQRLLADADARTAAAIRAYLAAIEEARVEAVREPIAAALAAGRAEEVRRVIEEAWDRVARRYRVAVAGQLLDALEAGGGIAAGGFRIELGLVFDRTNPAAVTFAREHAAGLVTQVTTDLRATLRDEITRAFVEQVDVWETAGRIRQVIGLRLDQQRALANYRAELKALQASTRPVTKLTRMRRLSSKGLTDARLEAWVERYRQRLLRQRAVLIARTEILAASNAGQLELWRQAVRDGQLGAGALKRWVVTPDDRLCFAAGTLVSTPSGPRGIETVAVGDLVDTHAGPRRVTAAVARPTRARLIKVQTARGVALATPDHPYLVRNASGAAEWVLAASLKEGDLLCAPERATDTGLRADAAYIHLCDPDDVPTLSIEPGRLSSVPRFVSVPVLSVGLDDKPSALQQEVHAVPADARLLGECNAGAREGDSDIALQSRLAGVAAIAVEGAEAFGADDGWDHAELLAAVGAVNPDGRPSTFLRAIFPGAALVAETLPASRTVSVGALLPAAFKRAHGVAVGDYGGYVERLLADGAHLRDLFGSVGCEVAGAATPLPPAKVLAFLGLENCRALLASELLGVLSGAPVVAGGGAELPIGLRHCIATPDALAHSGSSVVVYSLEVEGARTFIAGGTLVHNCPRCKPLDGQVRPLEAFFEAPDGTRVLMPPLHPNCRCAAALRIEPA